MVSLHVSFEMCKNEGPTHLVSKVCFASGLPISNLNPELLTAIAASRGASVQAQQVLLKGLFSIELKTLHLLFSKADEVTWPPQEEHAEYVRSMATLSAVMAGFVNIALIQFDFDARDIPIVVLMGFGVTNALTVSSATSAMH